MQDLPCVAHVAVEQPVDTLLDYLIPSEMQSRCAIGQRVLVPLGPRQVQGYIVGFAERTSVAAPKPLADVLDDTPLITADLLQLTRWVAAYYMCPWGLVLKAAVPQGFRVRSETIYHLSPRVLAESQNWPTGRAADLLHYVSQHGPVRSCTRASSTWLASSRR
jgi:primosomal protein N' (replication factor Y)